MKSWELFLPEVLLDVPNCPDVVAVNAIRNAAIDFCDKAPVWLYDYPTKVDLTLAIAEYTLTPPADSNIATVTRLGFWSAGATSPSDVTGPVSPFELDKERAGWREEVCAGANQVDLFTLTANVIRVVPIPVVSQVGALSVSVALKPSRASDEGADTLYDDWLEWIAHGAKEKLLLMPKKEWSNPQLASFHGAQFRRGINRALAKVLKGGGNRSRTLYAREFGRP